MSVSRVTPYRLINNDNKHQFYDYNSSDDDNDDDESNCIPTAAAATSGDFTTDYASPCENNNDADSTYTKNKQPQQQKQKQQQQQQQMVEMNSPPQPTASQSTSRLRNAFQRLRGTSVSKANHIAPAEIIKPTPSKSSLAEKIKNKLQQQFEYNNAKKILPKSKEKQQLGGGGNGRGMIRSTSFSNAWSKWGNNNNATAAKHIVRSSSVNLFHYQQQQQQPESKKSYRYQKHNTSSKKKKVSFAKLVSVRETFSRIDYDRVSDPYAICNRLTPAIAQQIKEELNAYKLHEMQVHEYSRIHTHFFI